MDDKIASLQKKKGLLEDYKKGCMQKLFSQQIRFTNGSGKKFPDWQQASVSDFCDSLSGTPVKGEEILEEKTAWPLLRGINITEGAIRHSEDIDRFHGGDISSLKKFILKEKDVVIGMDGSKVGKNVAIIQEKDAGSILIQRVTRLRQKGDDDLRYVYQHIISNRFHRYVDIVNTSSGIPHISLKQIRDFPIPYPHPDEQKKIADFLSAIDDKIALVSEELDKAKTFKKGLLQQMFV